jgi:hypothetical protein
LNLTCNFTIGCKFGNFGVEADSFEGEDLDVAVVVEDTFFQALAAE